MGSVNFPLEIQTVEERKDVAVIATNAKLGNSIKVTRKRSTAGKHVATD
ncbi:MAG: hypothetical protein U9O89_01295 [Thermoproteota archaeon]|nr:hypothetical protein [Thermoproteota archaeon]